jgi:hypothetical protein
MSFKAKMAGVALAATLGTVLMPGVAFATAAPPNAGGTNCHGVWMSYGSTSGMAPGQLQKTYGISVKDVQAVADIVCG